MKLGYGGGTYTCEAHVEVHVGDGTGVGVGVALAARWPQPAALRRRQPTIVCHVSAKHSIMEPLRPVGPLPLSRLSGSALACEPTEVERKFALSKYGFSR
ncbi:hypothetical protein AMTR_s00059p00136380 [Amborella trichopoda]|uniref:Uncharacterized protein n=1 Tax=Amborella trichopoda TaxID=13333 RepID=U5D5T3_AMBTC|nr:hypothetical protein AMTR_s00059p00136380 [Amborella trichopoda]